jgi:hypothetical protein
MMFNSFIYRVMQGVKHFPVEGILATFQKGFSAVVEKRDTLC